MSKIILNKKKIFKQKDTNKFVDHHFTFKHYTNRSDSNSIVCCWIAHYKFKIKKQYVTLIYTTTIVN